MSLRRPAEILGLKEKSNLDEWLKTATKEQMQEQHENCSYRKGSAEAGLVINGSLMITSSPTNLVGTAINVQQLRVASREQRRIEKAAKEIYGVDFQQGSDRVARRRHKLMGAAFKTSTMVALLGQDDIAALGTALGGLHLLAPTTELEVTEAFKEFHGNSVMSAVQTVADEPAEAAQSFFGIDHKPTWADLLQAQDMKLATSAVGAIGASAEANVVLLAADKVGEEAHRQSVHETSKQRHGASYGWNHRGRLGPS